MANESGTVVLFYKYVAVQNPEAERVIQKCWWDELGISGRMRLSAEGVNANLYGTREGIEEYKRRMESSEYWGGIHYKHTKPHNIGKYNKVEDPFDGVRKIRVSKEITGSGPMKNFLPTALGGNGGKHLAPKEFHNLVRESQEDEDILIIDTRNHYETVVGKFRNAIDPKLRCFGEFPGWIEANIENLKNKRIGLYCTGGIRCEKASAFVKSLNVAKEVYQLDGGIHSYLSEFSEHSGKEQGVYMDGTEVNSSEEGVITGECQYEGVNFQFDNRFSEQGCGLGEKQTKRCCVNCFDSVDPKIREDGRCYVCDNLILVCDDCFESFELRELACPEHKLLGDGWRNYLDLLLAKQWNRKDLELALVSLKRNLEVPVYKQCNGWKVDRIEDLKTQIKRVTEYLTDLGNLVSNSSASQDHSEFVPYVPFLNP